jgi:hypothetical protein
MTQTLREFVEQASWAAEKIFKATGIIRPMYDIVMRSGERFAVPGSGRDKDEMVRIARATLLAVDAVRYCFINEGWMKYYDQAKGERAPPDIKQRGIEFEPGRIEVLLFHAEDEDGTTMTAHRDIVRPSGHKPYLGKLDLRDVTDVVSEGRMFNLLKKKLTS